MIIIDDPIASVDDVNKMYVLELVKKVNELKNVQIFTFTHVWEDFCNICYGKQNKDNYKFFEIKRAYLNTWERVDIRSLPMFAHL